MLTRLFRVASLAALLGLTGCSGAPGPKPGGSPSSQPAAVGDSSSGQAATDPAAGGGAAPPAPDVADGSTTGPRLRKPVATPPHDPQAAREVGASLLSIERFAGQSDQQLGKIKNYIVHPEEKSDAWTKVIASDFSCASLRPENLKEVFRDEQIVVRREPDADDADDAKKRPPTANGETGLAAFSMALHKLIQPLQAAGHPKVKFKTFRVFVENDMVVTLAYYHAAGVADSRVVEQSATWRLEWVTPGDGEDPLLKRIVSSKFEEIETLGSQGPLFGDSTLAVIGNVDSFQKQLSQNVEQWRIRIQADTEVDFRGHHGMALGDVNGDGLDDLYLCQPNALPDLLYLQNPDGTLRDVSQEAGINWLDATKSVLLVDLDNDGDQDLVLSTAHALLFMENDGKAHFKLAAQVKGPRRPHSLTAADYDGDGDVDIFVCGFWRFDVYKADPLRAAVSLPTPWHDANNGAPNFLYRNDGKFKFADVTKESGLDQNNKRFSHAAAWEDFDNDGDLDLYIANDFGRNNLYRNDGGKFTDIAEEAGVVDLAAGMSVTWADYDQDGWMDLYVSNMFSSAGGRVTGHSTFQQKLDDSTRSTFRRHARGNSLFRNRGGKAFDDVSEGAAVVLGRWAWSSNFIDFNNDGREDLFVANGYVTNEDTGDL